ncbi:MAG TPA: hypothetical protein DFS52_13040, partial [Myxococcales bacterium]|nr:hypothetical protein [Myxococcales bacterium]
MPAPPREERGILGRAAAARQGGRGGRGRPTRYIRRPLPGDRGGNDGQEGEPQAKRCPGRARPAPFSRPARAAAPAPSARAPAPAPRPAAPSSFAGSAPSRPLIERGPSSDAEHRGFPRAQVSVGFERSIPGADGAPRFSARLRSLNLSVSGVFLESSFFLPLRTRLRTLFRIDESGPLVEAEAEIVRQQRPGPRDGSEHSGFAVRFLEFSGRTEVTLAKLFVGEQLRAFAQDYLESARARSLRSELDRVVDALAAWELQKV